MWTVILSAQTGELSATPDPFGSPSGPGLWKHKGWKLPNYVEQVAHGILKSGGAASESEAIQKAIGVLKNWASGQGKVRPEVRAAAAKAIAEWTALKARAGSSSHAAVRTGPVELNNVASPAGVVRYKAPIGTPIVAGKAQPGAPRVTTAKGSTSAGTSGPAAPAALNSRLSGLPTATLSQVHAQLVGMDQTNPAVHQATVGVAAALASRPAPPPSGTQTVTVGPGAGVRTASPFQTRAAGTTARNKATAVRTAQAGAKHQAVLKARAARRAKAAAKHRAMLKARAHRKALAAAKHRAVLRRRAAAHARKLAHAAKTAHHHAAAGKKKSGPAKGHHKKGAKAGGGGAAGAQKRIQDLWSAQWLG